MDSVADSFHLPLLHDRYTQLPSPEIKTNPASRFD